MLSQRTSAATERAISPEEFERLLQRAEELQNAARPQLLRRPRRALKRAASAA